MDCDLENVIYFILFFSPSPPSSSNMSPWWNSNEPKGRYSFRRHSGGLSLGAAVSV